MGFPRAIAHVDADAFFASVEQALHPEYRGRPVVTGQERNIVAAASYEAKALGVKRGVALWDVKKICPDCVIVPSDYETYSLYSLRMFAILGRYSPPVEAVSIDEAYVELTGVARLFRKGYRAIAADMQEAVRHELGIGVSVGVSLTKTLAKIAARVNKPLGLTAVPEERIADLLAATPVGEVCGIGPSARSLLEKHGVLTARDYARLPEAAARKFLGKIGGELWLELNGASVLPVVSAAEPPRSTITKSKTFAPPSADREFVRAHCIRNLESALIKARRHGLAAGRLILFLRRRDYRTAGDTVRLERATAAPAALVPRLNEIFDRLYDPAAVYRSTGVVLAELAADDVTQYSLFEDVAAAEAERELGAAIDGASRRFGKHLVATGTALYLKRPAVTSRAAVPERKRDLLPGESARRRVGIPVWKLGV